MNRKLELLVELSTRTCDSITSTKADWREFLKFSAKFYKYNFSDTLLLYAQNPTATACADYDTWNRIGRYVNRGEKGLPLIDTSLANPTIKYVFDVEQTNSQTILPPHHWELKEEFLQPVIAEIKSQFGASSNRGDYKDIKSAVERYARTSCNTYLEGIYNDLQGSLLEHNAEENAKQYFINLVVDTVGYIVAERCQVPQGLYDNDELAFTHLSDFNTKTLITRVGTATTQISENILRVIERKVKALEKENILKQRSVQYERKNTQQDDNSRDISGISSVDRGIGESATGTSEDREIRTDGNAILERTEPQPPEYADFTGTAQGTIRPSGRNSQSTDGSDNVTTTPENSTATDRELRGNDQIQQPNSRHSGGNHTSRDSIPAEIIELEGAAEAAPSFVPEQIGFADIVPTKKHDEIITQSEVDTSVQERNNFSITDADEIGIGGSKTKYKQNIEAIILLKNLEQSGEAATPEQQKILAKYAGWGGIPQAFDENKSDWAKEYTQLKELLSEEEYRSAKGSTLNAHYTSTQVIDAMYQGLRWLGYDGGNMLEPAMGVGNFFGRLPEDMQNSKLHGVELDSITGQIAKQLYQNAHIQIRGFERTDYPDNFFDVAVGNVPFGSYGVADPRYDKHNFLIHDYFVAKTLDKVRPGGIVALITSKGTMDKRNTHVRQYLSERAELLGAIRLPNTAFKQTAGTEVTTDILFLKKKDDAVITEEENKWLRLEQLPNTDILVNQYFVEHPDMMLGTMAHWENMYGNENETALLDDGRDLSVALHEAVRNLPFNSMTVRDVVDEIGNTNLLADLSVRNYCYTIVDGEIYQRENSRMIKQDFTGTAAERVKGLIEIRDQVRHLINIQTENCSDDVLTQAQGKLNSLYDKFVKKYDSVSSRGNNLAFRDDADYPMLCALEIVDDSGSIKKADMFTMRTIRARQAVTSCDTSSEALTISLNEKGRLDLQFMTSLTGKPLEEITEDLQGIIFKNPLSDEVEDDYAGWETADEYLSGNVRNKLEIAVKAAEKDDRYSVNLEKLQTSQPEWLEAKDIDVRLGATWVGTDIVKQFLVETLHPSQFERTKLDISYSAINATWSVTGKPYVGQNNVEAYSVYGTQRVNGYELADTLLNLRTVSVYDVKYVDGKEKRVLNKPESIAAREKSAQIQTAFKRWVFDDPDRRERLVGKYNQLFNSDRLRAYDGSHLTFEGMSPTIGLREHQTNAIARTLYGGNTLLAHEVGSGKTFTMIASAMELRRLGLAQKPMFVVPNHLTDQWASEFLRLYPSANILVATKKDFEKHNRRRFVSKIATGDYDGVIIGHSSFEKIPMSLARRKDMINQEIDEITDAIYEASSDKSKGHSMVKRLEATKKRLEVRLEKLTDESKKDDLLNFEQLGIDCMFVDESHSYKNLFLYSKMSNVAGIPQTNAKKSSDMYLKVQYINEINGGKRGVIFATGTPLSNSVTELYTLQRYLQLHRLRGLGLQMFDAWAGNFGEKVTAMELSPDGSGYRQKERFSKFYNVPELMNLFREFADIQTADMLQLPVPKCRFEIETAPASDELIALIEELMARAELVKNGIDPSIENMLKITNDGRKAALDIRLIDPSFPDLPDSKVNIAANKIYRIWDETKADKLTQLVFSDLSTPDPKKFNIYYDIRKKLVAKGIPQEEIAFIHDAKTDVQKAKLFEAVRRGDIRVLIGSTSKMGAGTNVQDKLIHLHHLDVPWRPSDVIQREGRALRQGNQNEEIGITRYITERSFDSYSWQIIESKQRFISQIMSGQSVARSIDDIDEKALSYAELKAIATGDPRILRKNEVDMEVSRLETLFAHHRHNRYRLEDNIIKYIPKDIADCKERISSLQKDLVWIEKNSKPDFTISVGGKTFSERKDAGEMLKSLVANLAKDQQKLVGEYSGLQLYAGRDVWDKPYLHLKNNLTYSLEYSDDAVGAIIRIENRASKIDTELINTEERLVKNYTALESSKAEYNKPFDYTDDLTALQREQQELNMALNLDKNEENILCEVQSDELVMEVVDEGEEI